MGWASDSGEICRVSYCHCGLLALVIHAVFFYFLPASLLVKPAPMQATLSLSFPVAQFTHTAEQSPAEAAQIAEQRNLPAEAEAAQIIEQHNLPAEAETAQIAKQHKLPAEVARTKQHKRHEADDSAPLARPAEKAGDKTNTAPAPSYSAASELTRHNPPLPTQTRVIHRPGVQRQTPPVYPPRAIALRQEGTVLLDVYLHADGRPGKLRVLHSSGYPLLDTAALDSVKDWLFHAPAAKGARTDQRVRVPVRFELR